MPDYSLNKSNIEFGGGNLLVNLVDSRFAQTDWSKFTSVGATAQDSGGTLHLGERKVRQVWSEADRDEPSFQWIEGQEVTFETVLVETNLENLALALGVDVGSIVNHAEATPKYKELYFYDRSLPKWYPMIYEVPRTDYPTLKSRLIMPACEVLGAQEFQMIDTRVHAVKLTLKLHRVIEPDGVSLMTNGAFERGADPLTDWTVVENGGADLTIFNGSVEQPIWDPTDPSRTRMYPVRAGLHSCKFLLPNGSNASIKQTPTLLANTPYMISIWAYATRPAVPLTFTFGGQNYNRSTGPNAYWWYNARASFMVPTEQAYDVKVYAANSSGSEYSVFIDEVSLIKIDPSDPLSSGLSGRKFAIRVEYP